MTKLARYTSRPLWLDASIILVILGVSTALGLEQGMGAEARTALLPLVAFVLPRGYAYGMATYLTFGSWYALYDMCDYRYEGPTDVLHFSHEVYSYLWQCLLGIVIVRFLLRVVRRWIGRRTGAEEGMNYSLAES